MEKSTLALCETRQYKTYRITEINTDENMHSRLRELGIIEGTKITRTVVGQGEEISVYVARGTRIALRRETAEQIRVTECEE